MVFALLSRRHKMTLNSERNALNVDRYSFDFPLFPLRLSALFFDARYYLFHKCISHPLHIWPIRLSYSSSSSSYSCLSAFSIMMMMISSGTFFVFIVIGRFYLVICYRLSIDHRCVVVPFPGSLE